MVRWLVLAALVAACKGEPGDEPVVFDELPDPGDWGIAGPGGPAVPLTGLNTACSWLTGGPQDVEHHNLVSIYDGWLVLPWAPEYGGGGISLFDIADPCDPVKVGEGYSDFMRESHTLAFGEVDGRTFLAVDYHEETEGDPLGGVGFWEITDPTAPVWVSALALPNYAYPDAYLRVTLSTFWQGDHLYVAGAGNGVFVVDVSDPENPVHLGTVTLDTAHLAGTFHVIGNLAMNSSAGLPRTVLMDVSDPEAPVQIPGGDFRIQDSAGRDRGYYFSNVGGKYALFARNNDAGGPIVYDISDPSTPTWVGEHPTPDGDGGYIFRHEDKLFLGDSNHASIYDFSDPSAMSELARLNMRGDFDTLTPIGNVAIASVDEGAESGKATTVFPWREQPDDRGPVAELVSPMDGATQRALTSRIGASFDEQIEAMSAHAGSFRVWDDQGHAVPGRFNVQESIVNFTPDEELLPDTTYIVEIPAGGIADVSGNPTESDLSWMFSTGAEVSPPKD